MDKTQQLTASAGLSTAEFAAQHGIQGESVRRHWRALGHYYGSVPVAGPNGRLRWPAVTAVKITDPA